MSAIIIRIEEKEITTNVYVDGKLAYMSAESPNVIERNLTKLFELLYIENIEFKIK